MESTLVAMPSKEELAAAEKRILRAQRNVLNLGKMPGSRRTIFRTQLLEAARIGRKIHRDLAFHIVYQDHVQSTRRSVGRGSAFLPLIDLLGTSSSLASRTRHARLVEIAIGWEQPWSEFKRKLMNDGPGALLELALQRKDVEKNREESRQMKLRSLSGESQAQILKHRSNGLVCEEQAEASAKRYRERWLATWSASGGLVVRRQETAPTCPKPVVEGRR